MTNKIEINENRTVATVNLGLDGNGDEQFEKIIIVSYDDDYENGIGHDDYGDAVFFDDEKSWAAHEGDTWENAIMGIKFEVSHGLEWVDEEDEEDEEVEEDDNADWETLVHYMDNEIREKVHGELAPCSNEEFLARYKELHLLKHGLEFSIPD